MSLSQDARTIFSALDLALVTEIPVLIGRNGSTELQAILTGQYNEAHMTCAGIWPPSYYDGWRIKAVDATLAADVLATGWYETLADQESSFLNNYRFIGSKVCLKALEPYYVDKQLRWTNLLEGQKVAVISPFADLCASQYLRREDIWTSEEVLPANMEIVPVKTGFAPAICGSSKAFSWPVTNANDACAIVVKAVINSGAKIALIGCGGLGMLIAHQLKNLGVSSIVMGGALQVLFGIKGRRWTQTPIAEFWNEAWVWPPAPQNAHLIEGGCYW